MSNILLNILKKVLKILARATLWRYKPTIIGITGNVGKSSAKEATKIVLGHIKKVRASSKSFNNELGLPLTILGDWKETGGFFFWLKVLLVSCLRVLIKSRSYPEILILEYGIDRPGDMNRLLEIARPRIGVVTFLGNIPVHVEFFGGPEAVAREKSKLVQRLPAIGFAILNIDDPMVYDMKDQTRANVITYGFDENADIRITSFETIFTKKEVGLTFKINYGGSFIPVRLENVLGRSHAYAAAVATGLGLIFEMNLVTIAEALSRYVSLPGRLKVLPGIKGTQIIDDTYNASPSAMEEALNTLAGIKAARKIAVLGDMLEIGKYTLEAHERIGRLAAKTVDVLITVGMRGKFISEAAAKSRLPQKYIFHFDNIKEASIFIQGKIRKGDVILVKGSQAVRMEYIVKEIIANPQKTAELLVRQEKRWQSKKSIYE